MLKRKSIGDFANNLTSGAVQCHDLQGKRIFKQLVWKNICVFSLHQSLDLRVEKNKTALSDAFHERGLYWLCVLFLYNNWTQTPPSSNHIKFNVMTENMITDDIVKHH